MSAPGIPAVSRMQRVVGALQHRELDRVPVALAVGLHGAREIGVTLPELFNDPAKVIEADMRMFAKYGSDVIAGTWFAPMEYEAWGGEILWFDDGPPNSGAPVIRNIETIPGLQPPRVGDLPRGRWMLEALTEMRRRVGPDVPILGGVVSPHSLPVMLMGFEAYLNVILERRDLYERLTAVVEEWTVAWGNAQLAAGATALAYFDPLASSTILTPNQYRETGYKVARRTIPRLQGPTITFLASGRSLPVIDTIAQTGTLAIGPSVMDDLDEVVAATKGRLTIVGNLNGIEMRHWTQQQAEAKVRDLIQTAGPGGGLIVCDNHGEIPIQVPEDTILAISEAVRTWGRFPIAGGDG